MRQLKHALFCAFLLFHAAGAEARDKAHIQIASAKQRTTATVAFTLTSSADFIMGDNKYVLHIGQAQFDLYEQGDGDNQAILTFLIPSAAYNQLHGSEPMYVTYGEVQQESFAELAKDGHFPCWYLGEFSTSLLSK